MTGVQTCALPISLPLSRDFPPEPAPRAARALEDPGAGGEGRWEALGHTLSPQRTPRPGPARPPTQPGGNLKSGAAQPPPQEGRVGTPPTKVAPERGAPKQVALKTEESRLHEDPSLGSYRARLSDSHGGAQRRRGLRRREGRRDAVGAGLVCLPCSVVLRGRHLA